MAVPLLERNTWALISTEPSYNDPLTPSPTGADALLCSQIGFQPLDNETETAVRVKGSPGADADVTTCGVARFTPTVEFRYDEPAGTPPRFGRLMTACGMAQVISVAPYTGTADAASTAGTLVFPAGAEAGLHYYTGAVGTFIAGTESGRTFTIVHYNGGTLTATIKAHDGQAISPDGTSEFSINRFVQYRPTSLSFDAPDSSYRGWHFFDKIKHYALGGRGTMSNEISVKAIPRMSFEMTALYQQGADASTPAPSFLNTTQPQAVNLGNTPVIDVFGIQGLCFESDSLQLGNEMTHQVSPGCTEFIGLTDRSVTGTITLKMPLLANVDFYEISRLQTQGRIAITHGTASGRYCTIVRPQCTLQAPQPGATDTLRTIAMAYKALPTDASTGLLNTDIFYTFC